MHDISHMAFLRAAALFVKHDAKLGRLPSGLEQLWARTDNH